MNELQPIGNWYIEGYKQVQREHQIRELMEGSEVSRRNAFARWRAEEMINATRTDIQDESLSCGMPGCGKRAAVFLDKYIGGGFTKRYTVCDEHADALVNEARELLTKLKRRT